MDVREGRLSICGMVAAIKGQSRASERTPIRVHLPVLITGWYRGLCLWRRNLWHGIARREKILPIGYPRYDWMLAPSMDKAAALKKLFQWENPSGKAVIWLPTFRQSNLKGCREGEIRMPYQLPAIQGMEEMKKLDAYLRGQNVLLIIKKHPLQTKWSQEGQFSNIRYVTEEMLEKADLQLAELMGVCDGLISDYSSAAVDFMLLDRPIGYVLTDFKEYEEKEALYLKILLLICQERNYMIIRGWKLFLDMLPRKRINTKKKEKP